MKGSYLLALVAMIFCLALVDNRFKLAYFKNKTRTLKTLITAAMIFIFWDVAGIILKIFFIGTNKVLTGIKIGQFPLEEVFFLVVLCYSSLLMFNFVNTRKDSK